MKYLKGFYSRNRLYDNVSNIYILSISKYQINDSYL